MLRLLSRSPIAFGVIGSEPSFGETWTFVDHVKLLQAEPFHSIESLNGTKSEPNILLYVRSVAWA